MEHTTTVRRGPNRAVLAIAVALAGATFGITGAAAIADDEKAPAVEMACRSSEMDLLRAAFAARQLEAERPELFEDGTRSRYEDLRLAAEWARRLEIMEPELVCGTALP